MSIDVVWSKGEKDKLSVSDLAIGDTVIGSIGGRHKSLYLKTYSNIVDLTNPRHTWGHVIAGEFSSARKVDIEITIKERKDC